MPTPLWWNNLIAASDVLAASDRAEVDAWRGEPETSEFGLPVEVDEDDVPPLTVRLGSLARVFAKNASGMDAQERQRVLGVLEKIQATGSEEDQTAVVTGFFEALLMAADLGFDLRSVWDELGPGSRSACLSLNEFWGVDSPGWMR
ncbi:DUF7674 family protein [Streptomyces luteireticuli]|uniref:DUF7674 domain-containing protein n=1 Tax=Streptomyces luteireticuli TaxID=173858 RepID=A0ABN0YWV0_9ACTN